MWNYIYKVEKGLLNPIPDSLLPDGTKMDDFKPRSRPLKKALRIPVVCKNDMDHEHSLVFIEDYGFVSRDSLYRKTMVAWKAAPDN